MNKDKVYFILLRYVNKRNPLFNFDTARLPGGKILSLQIRTPRCISVNKYAVVLVTLSRARHDFTLRITTSWLHHATRIMRAQTT